MIIADTYLCRTDTNFLDFVHLKMYTRVRQERKLTKK